MSAKRAAGVMLRARGITRRFGGLVANEDVSFRVDDKPGIGEVVVFLGPSGCGKSTILKALAGLVPPADGVARLDGVALASRVRQRMPGGVRVARVGLDRDDARAVGCRAFDKVPDHVVGIVRISDRIGRSQQHLQQKVRHGLPQLCKAVPWIFLQKAHCDVKGGAAPAFDRKELRQQARVVRRDGSKVMRTNACCQEALVRVSHRGVGDQDAT